RNQVRVWSQFNRVEYIAYTWAEKHGALTFTTRSASTQAASWMHPWCGVSCFIPLFLRVSLPAFHHRCGRGFVRNGDWFLCLLVANNGECQDEESMGGRCRTEALRKLCQINPSQALNIRAMVVEECHLPGLSVALTLDYKPDVADDAVSPLVSYISGLLLGPNGKVRTWFSMFICNGQPHVVKASTLLRLYCALMGIAGLRPTDEEAEQLLQLMISRPPATPARVRFVSLSFYAFSAAGLNLSPLYFSLSLSLSVYSAAGVAASFTEMLLLVAMYFHSNYLTDLWVNAPLQIAIKPSFLSKMKTIFTQEIFIEQVLHIHSHMVAVTNNLCANIIGFLRAFTKGKVSIKDWIYRQLCETSSPLHTQLLPLINVYINSILTPDLQGQPQGLVLSITIRLALWQVEGGRGVRSRYSITTQLLILYYILSYEEALMAITKQLSLLQRKSKSYSATLMDQIPIKYLITQAQGLQQELGLHSALLRLLATNYPHLCMVEDWVCEVLVTGTLPLFRRMLLTSNTCRYSTTKVLSSGPRLMRTLDHLTLLSSGDLIPYAEALMDSMGLLLGPGVPRRIPQTLNKLWMVLNTVMPLRLWVMMVNALQPSVKMLRHQNLMVDALIVLCSDQRLLASKAGQPEVTREELKNALLAAQVTHRDRYTHSYMCTHTQCIGEGGLEGGLLSDLREVQCRICCLLHQMFIADPNIAKLVHFQGCPQALLHLTVVGIPSIHICLDFIPELSGPAPAEETGIQIFAIQLLSHLCSQYTQPKSLSVARLCCQLFAFFMPTLLCLVAFCQAFPPLYDDVAALLVQVGQVCASDVATKARDIDLLIASKFVFNNVDPLRQKEQRRRLIQQERTCKWRVESKSKGRPEQ
uniref:Integrator complex subunit 2 n=1 Tax=Oncorhynchus mykiss TaxID=8022 RepID=A0A8K9WXX6_ONCMY